MRDSTPPRRFLVAAFGDPGHVFPAIALGRALAGRRHEVTIETWEERRAAVEGAGLGFAAAEEYRMFPPPDPDSPEGAHAAEAARALLPLLEEFMTSRGQSERAACLVAVTRIRHTHPGLRAANGSGEGP